MIAQIAAAYGLDVEDELASIIPDSEHDDEVEKAWYIYSLFYDTTEFALITELCLDCD